MTGEICLNAYITSISHIFSNCQCLGNGALLIINNYTLGILWGRQCFFVFDSHSRDENGKQSPNGTAVLLKFHSLAKLEEYIKNTYYGQTQQSLMYFQIQFIKFICAEDDIQVISSELRRLRTLKKQRERYSKNPGPRLNQLKRKYQDNPTPYLNYASKHYAENPFPKLEKQRQNYAENPFPKLEKQRQNYAENPFPKLEKQRQNYAENPFPKLEKQRQNYAENPGPKLERKKQNYAENPDPQIQRVRKNYFKNPLPKLQRQKQNYAENSTQEKLSSN